jgi:hypothetical protein
MGGWNTHLGSSWNWVGTGHAIRTYAPFIALRRVPNFQRQKCLVGTCWKGSWKRLEAGCRPRRVLGHCPLCPQKRTFVRALGMCQKRTSSCVAARSKNRNGFNEGARIGVTPNAPKLQAGLSTYGCLLRDPLSPRHALSRRGEYSKWEQRSIRGQGKAAALY